MKNFWKNCFFLPWIWLSRKKKQRLIKKILVVSTTGLGDTLWATPALRALKAKYPDAHIAFLTRPLGKQTLEGSPFIDVFYELKKPFLFKALPLAYRLKKQKFETAFIFHASQRILFLLVHYLRIPRVVGNKGMSKGLDGILTDKVIPKDQHEVVRRLNLVAIASATTKDHTLYAATKPFELKAKKKPWVALHMGAKDGFKQWPKDAFIALATRLVQELEIELFFTGSRQEFPLIEASIKPLPKSTNLAGALDVQELAFFLAQVDLFITNDTGPMHIASAVQAPTIALFSPTHFSRCGPIPSPNMCVLSKRRACTPCFKRKCFEPFCLRQISVEKVFRSSRQMLALSVS